MTVEDKVRQCLLRLTPAAACDDCLAFALKIQPRQHVNHKTRALAQLPNYDRRIGFCSLCEKRTKLVIRHKES